MFSRGNSYYNVDYRKGRGIMKKATHNYVCKCGYNRFKTVEKNRVYRCRKCGTISIQVTPDIIVEES